MKVIYVAGPFRAANAWEIEQNVRRAEAAALEVWRAGAVAICPHANTRFYQGALPDAVWMEGELEILRRCDAVLVLENWKVSTGTLMELVEAQGRSMPIFYSIMELNAWLSREHKFDAAV
jgi:nucleoside 2-deoxyribosyltransferase